MVNQLGSFASEVTRVAREVGIEGKLGGQAKVKEIAGTWKDLIDNVNFMAGNLTSQVRNIAEVTTAVAKGDLSKKIAVDVKGEFLELKNTINTMVDQLSSFASEATRVAREVGVEAGRSGQRAGRSRHLEEPDGQCEPTGRQGQRVHGHSAGDDGRREGGMKSKILVVDDNSINLKLVSELLEIEGHQILKAADAEEAQVILANTLPELILMDIALPGMDGLTLARKLKADERTRHICIVALTAFAMKGDDQQAFDAGCDGYITKPIGTRKLPGLVAELLAKERLKP